MGWIHRSYALHQLNRTQEAWDNLLAVVDGHTNCEEGPLCLPVGCSFRLQGFLKCIYGFKNPFAARFKLYSKSSIACFPIYLAALNTGECRPGFQNRLILAAPQVAFEGRHVSGNLWDGDVVKLSQLIAWLPIKFAAHNAKLATEFANGLPLLAAKVQGMGNDATDQREGGVKDCDLGGIPTHELV
ncbi:MAG: hypothetical protein ACYDH9_03570 [Limisphaerales bacterium]